MPIQKRGVYSSFTSGDPVGARGDGTVVLGNRFTIHGFASDGRHDVEYHRFKDFDDYYDDSAKAKLAGMQGGLSTRMGAALRHAASFLFRQPEQKKLILLVTDGELADINVRDPKYLRHDTKKARGTGHARREDLLPHARAHAVNRSHPVISPKQAGW